MRLGILQGKTEACFPGKKYFDYISKADYKDVVSKMRVIQSLCNNK